MSLPRLAAALLIAPLLIAATLPAIPTAAAQSLYSVVVKIDDIIVSRYDLNQRIAIITAAANGRTPQNVEAIALQSLIDDHLKLQEGEREGVSPSEEEVENAIAEVAKNNNLKKDSFLAQLATAGVDKSTLSLQLRSELAWNELLRRRYGQRVAPTEEEIDSFLDQTPDRENLRYDLQQVVVPVSGRGSSADVRTAFTRAQDVRKGIKGCADVATWAQRYPRQSGKVGKLLLSQMPGPIAKAVGSMRVGDASEPLRSSSGFHVVVLCGTEKGKGVSRSKVYDRLVQENVSRFAESYLDDLRRSALIERRL
ncbi:MAG: SurA N-terminal domain-containing protein [Pseudomonadota bacterium]